MAFAVKQMSLTGFQADKDKHLLRKYNLNRRYADTRYSCECDKLDFLSWNSGENCFSSAKKSLRRADMMHYYQKNKKN